MKTISLLPLFALVTGCMSYPPPPPITPNPPGGLYRAQGAEPFWFLTIDPRQMVFTDRANDMRIAEPTPPVIVGIAGEIYNTPRLKVNIVHQTCTLSNNAAVAYPDRVQVDVDGHQLAGCGGL